MNTKQKQTVCEECGKPQPYGYRHCPTGRCKEQSKHTPQQVRMAQDLAVSFGHEKNGELRLVHLYNSAPELLEAVKEYTRYVSDLIPRTTGEEKAYRMGLAAIAKAEGR